MKRMKTILALILAMSLLFTFVACDNGENGDTGTEDVKEVAVMVPAASHGWTGAVLTYAQEKVDELNNDAEFTEKYSAKLYSATGVENQIEQVDDLLTKKDDLAGIVILPYDNGLQSSLEKIANADVPFVQFDRVIHSEVIDENVVSSVLGDNVGIGYETGKRLLDLGLEPGHYVYEMIGDNSSVPELRSQGFRNALKEAGWSDADIESTVVKSPATGWSRDTGKELFESWFSSAQCDPSLTNWIFTHDDEIAMGILESMQGSALDEDKKEEYLDSLVSLASSSGLAEIYAVLKDKHQVIPHPEFDLFSVTYDPAMIKEAVETLITHLEGGSVEQNLIIPVSVVDKTNVDEFQPFGSYDEKE